jgi:hypothetical protein
MQLGVSSVREHLEGAMTKLDKFNKQKMALASQASKVKQALAYEGSSDAGKKVKEQEGEVADLKAKLQKLEEQEAAGRQSRQAQEADLEEKVCCNASKLLSSAPSGLSQDFITLPIEPAESMFHDKSGFQLAISGSSLHVSAEGVSLSNP